MTTMRSCFAALLALASANAWADVAFLQIPDVHGTAQQVGRTGWFEIAQHTLALAPPVLSSDKKTAFNACTATVAVHLLPATPTVAAMIGTVAGDIRIEVDAQEPGTISRAVLRSAVITSLTSELATGGDLIEKLTITFARVDLEQRGQNPDGSLRPPVQGSFVCAPAP